MMMTDDQRDTQACAPTSCEAAMPRRRFLGLALGAVGVTWSTVSEAGVAIPVRALTSPALLGMLGSERAVRHLGEGYRQLVPAENDARVLMQAILNAPTQIAAPDLAVALAEQVRQDFMHGRTVTVRGWILAVTEARQCALYSLHAA